MTSILHQPKHSVFLLGDAGEISEPAAKNLALLQSQLENSSRDTTFIMLGDNIYPDGLPCPNHLDRSLAEHKLKKQLAITRNFSGTTYVLPGNHDWDQAGPEGYQRILHQQAFIQGYFQDEQAFQPQQGLPGPSVINLNEELVLIIIDFQWFLHLWTKPGITHRRQELAMIEQVMTRLEHLLIKYKHQKVILATHHPMYSYGTHGKPNTWKNFIFPLKNRLGRRIWFPLPGFSYLFPFYPRFKTGTQDLAHPRYRTLKKWMSQILKNHPALIHVAGHDHSLQHLHRNGVHYIISGSGSKITSVFPGTYAKFACAQLGFARINFYENEEVWLEFWGVMAPNYQGEKLYKQRLFTRTSKPEVAPEPISSI